MYNEERKMAFIQQRESEVVMSPNTLKNIFSKTEGLEEEFDRDVAEFSMTEILDTYKRINTKSLDLLLNINTQLAYYAAWCMSRNLIPNGINNFQEITMEMLTECVNKLAAERGVMTKEEVVSISRRMKNARESFVVLMCYETGRSKYFQNIFKAKLSDFEDGKLKCYDGRVVKYSSDLFFAAQQADKELEYNPFLISTNPKVTSRKRMLIDDGYIYKETDTAKTDSLIRRKSRMNIVMKKNFDAIGVPSWVQLKDFENSGVIHFIKEIAQREGIGEENVLWNVNLRKEVENQYGIMIRSPKQFLRKFSQFLE